MAIGVPFHFMKKLGASLRQLINWLLRSKSGLIFLSIAVFFILLVSYQLYATLVVEQAVVKTNALNLAIVLESKINTDFESADRVVSDIALDIDSAAMHKKLVNSYALKITLWLKSRVKSITAASALSLFDTDGNLLYSSMEGASAFNISDRKYFRELKANNRSRQTIVSDIVETHPTGSPAMIVAKAVFDRKGHFIGVAATAIDLSYLSEQFGKIELGSKGVITLHRLNDGALIERYPGSSEVSNKSEPEVPVLKAIIEGESGGTIEGTSPVDGVRRIYGYKTIGKFPFFIEIGIADSDYLAEWRANSAIMLFGALLFIQALVAAESRRNNSETKLRESEQRFRRVLEHAPIGMITTALDGHFILVNQAFCTMLGYEKDELEKLTFQEVSHPEDKTLSFADRQKLLDGEIETSQLEKRYLRKDGQTVWGLLTSSIERNDSGSPPYFIAQVEDITERKKAESEIRIAATAFESHEGMAVTDENGTILRVNRAFTRITGYPTEEVIGRKIRSPRCRFLCSYVG